MIRILSSPTSRRELQTIADQMFGEIVKAVGDVQREVLAVGGELHADEESVLLTDVSRQGLVGHKSLPRHARRINDRVRLDDQCQTIARKPLSLS